MRAGWLIPAPKETKNEQQQETKQKQLHTGGRTKALGQMLGILLLQLGLTAQWAGHMTHIFMNDPSLS